MRVILPVRSVMVQQCYLHKKNKIKSQQAELSLYRQTLSLLDFKNNNIFTSCDINILILSHPETLVPKDMISCSAASSKSVRCVIW